MSGAYQNLVVPRIQRRSPAVQYIQRQRTPAVVRSIVVSLHMRTNDEVDP